MVRSQAFAVRRGAIAPARYRSCLSTRHSPYRTHKRSAHAAATTSELKECSIIPLEGTGTTCQFKDVWKPGAQDISLLLFFTHWADLGSWELAQRLVEHISDIQSKGVNVIAVGLGTKEAGQLFAEKTQFPVDMLYADPVGECHKALGYSGGFLPGSDVNGYVKLLPMLAGIGSPGTVQEVLRGYVGDRDSKAIFGADTFMGRAFGVLGDGYQRPFELATVRLTNMIGSLQNWSALAPSDTQLLVQQGGSLLMRGEEEVLYAHSDTGILMTTPTDPLMEAVQAATAARLPG